jgi:hypothetical protein
MIFLGLKLHYVLRVHDGVTTDLKILSFTLPMARAVLVSSERGLFAITVCLKISKPEFGQLPDAEYGYFSHLNWCMCAYLKKLEYLVTTEINSSAE